MGKVSIGDVARHAGVSPTTVSHTISGARTVSPELRRRVEDAMDALGYAPSRTARNLALGVTKVIGLLVPDIANGFFAVLAKGAEQEAISRGYNIIFGNTDFDHARGLLYLEMIRSRAIDGLIYAAGSPMAPNDVTAALGGIPLVLVDEEVIDLEAATLVSDNFRGGELVAEHLSDLGHRSALVIGANPDLPSSDLRIEGFRTRWSKVEGSEVVVVPGGFTEQGARDAMMALRAEIERHDVTAIFAANDLMAFAAVDVLQTWGLAVPADVSVVGFDDIDATRYSSPQLTTVRQDAAELGRTAVSMLLDALEDSTHPKPARRVLPVELVARGSTGPRRDPDGGEC